MEDGVWFFYSGITTGPEPKFFNGLIRQDVFDPEDAFDTIHETQMTHLGVPKDRVKIEILNRLNK